MGDAIDVIKEVAVPLDMKNSDSITTAMWSCIGTKFAARWGTLVVDMAV